MLTSFVIANPQRCLGCFTCMAACSVGHQQQGLQARPRLQITYSQVGTMPVQCHQCEDAPCALVCPVRAIEIEDGMVRLNEVNCIGCKMCVLACPFGAITVDGTAPASGGWPLGAPAGADESPDGRAHPLLAWLAGQKTVAIKCDLCYSGTDGPACVRFCPTKALQLVSEEQVERSVKLKRIDAVTSTASLLGEQIRHGADRLSANQGLEPDGAKRADCCSVLLSAEEDQGPPQCASSFQERKV